MPIKADLNVNNDINATSVSNSNNNISRNLSSITIGNSAASQPNQSNSTNTKSSSKSSLSVHNDSSSNSNGKFSRFDGGEQQIIVACRLRPLTEDEILEGSTLIGHKIADDNMIVLMDPMEDPDDILRANRSRERQFVFDMVFDAKSTQHDVYEKTTKGLLGGVLNGYNATVFAYGATGAGKTYTMLGTEEEPGIMFRTLHDLFIEITRNSKDLMYQVSMSYLEIYNELIRDLLSPSNGFLELREDAKGGVQVAGISELVAETPQEVMYMLHKGNKERTQEPTKANKTSSRSHAVLQVSVKQRNKVRSQNQEIRLGKLYMIDLAGSERAAQTQNTGKRMVEGAHINRSLLALGNCINALSEKGSTKYVNYRDSKLTRILKDSLGGNSKTVMIAHVSPASIHFEESRNTLVYADRAKYIRTKLRRNVIDVSYHISQYQQIIQELAQEIAMLKDQRSDLESRISHLDPRISMMNSEDKAKIEEALKLRESLLLSFKQQIKLRKNILELENAVMDLNIEAERHKKIIENTESQKENDKKSLASSIENSKAELKVVEQDLEEMESKKKEAFRKFEESKRQTKKLRDIAAKKLTNTEQKEILGLLLKNFEFEIRNIEMQADIFKRDFKLREQDMVILRLEQHRSLCDTLIFQQKRLIDENRIQLPQDLNELYYLYSRDINDGQLLKDLTSTRLTPSLITNMTSPKPHNTSNAFLTQIEEENGENVVKNNRPMTPTNYDDMESLKIDEFINSYSSKMNNNQVDYFDTNKIFYKTNNQKITNQMNNPKSNKKAKEANYHFVNNNYISGNGSGGLQTTTTSLVPHLAFNNKDKNNISMLSSSTNDSNMEIILENVPSITNKQLIKAGPPRPNPNKYAQSNGAYYNNNSNNANSNSITLPPGQIVPTSLYTGNKMNEKNAKRLTQGIVAIAAQRKATQHHKQLMQEIYEYDSNQEQLTNSPLARHDPLANSNKNNNKNLYDLNENSINGDKQKNFLTEGGAKTKKQVKIQEIVQFKLPDDDSDISLNKVNHQRYDENNIILASNKTKKPHQNSKRSKSNNNASNFNHSKNNSSSNQNLSNVKSLPTLNTSNNNAQNSSNNNNNSNSNSNQSSKLVKLQQPSIPNYSKNVNMSISGTSVLAAKN